MVNLMTMIYTAVAGQWVRWVRTIIAARLIAPLIKRTGLALFSASAAPLMRQQLLDSAVQLSRQPGEHILEVGPPCQTSCRPIMIAEDPHRSAIYEQKFTFN